jgi:hypothetical protein
MPSSRPTSVRMISFVLFACGSGRFSESARPRDKILERPGVFLSRGRQVPFHEEINTAKPSNGSAKRGTPSANPGGLPAPGDEGYSRLIRRIPAVRSLHSTRQSHVYTACACRMCVYLGLGTNQQASTLLLVVHTTTSTRLGS